MHFNKGKAYGRQGKAPKGVNFQHSILLFLYKWSIRGGSAISGYLFYEAVLYCSVAPSEALISGFATTEQELMWWFEPIGSCLSSITNSSPPDGLIIFPTLTASREECRYGADGVDRGLNVNL